jgi:hypothetical protein
MACSGLRGRFNGVSDAATPQLSYVRRDPPRFVFGQQLCRRSPPRLILEIDIRERLTVSVAHDEAGVQFLDSPRRREAACSHCSLVQALMHDQPQPLCDSVENNSAEHDDADHDGHK